MLDTSSRATGSGANGVPSVMEVETLDRFEQGLAPIAYRIDRLDRIVEVDDAWRAFAVANDAPELAGDSIVGRPLWDFIAGSETRQLWHELLDRVRTGVTADVSLRCDSPGRRRRLDLQLVPLQDGGVQFRATVAGAEDRAPVELLDSLYADGTPIRVCGWCRRVDVDGYVEVEEAIARLGLLEQDMRPVTHTLCPDCAATIHAQMAAQTTTPR